MNIFIRRPVMTTLVMLAVLLFGGMGYRLLPVSDLPTVDFPTIVVSANLPGASPETMAASVATPLEREFTTIAGLDSMTSTSGLGSTRITLQFTLDRDIDAAAQDVQAALAAVQRRLPNDMPAPPSYQKSNPAASPILFIALTSPTLSLPELTEYGETLLAQRISTVSGVAQVLVFGSQKYAVRIQLDPNRLAGRGLAPEDVIRAVAAANVNLPTGMLWGTHQAVTIEAHGQLDDAAAFRPIVVAYRDGAPVRLEELGRVIDSVENDKSASWFNDDRAIVLAIERQPGTNTVEVARAVKALLPSFVGVLPASVELNLLIDRSIPIHDSVRDVQFTLLAALILVILVIFLFLRNLSATAIPSLALPLSIVGTFAVMYLLDYSLNNLTLMALTLSVGFVVDDAIVMLENIVRHLEMGKRPLAAASEGAREVSFTIVSMTLSLAAVFIPLLFMGGIIGRLFKEFAVTIGVAILVSGFVSLSLTPMLCSRFLRRGEDRRRGRFYRATEFAFDRSLAVYERSLAYVMRHRRFTVLFTLAILAATGYLAAAVPKGFLPSEDTSLLMATTQAAEGISYQSMVEHQAAVTAIVARDPNVDSFMSSVGGGGGSSSSNQGRIFLRLKERSQRRLSADQVAQDLRRKLAAVPGIRTYIVNPPPINIGGRFSSSLYQFTLQGADLDELYRAAPLLEKEMQSMPELQDAASDLRLTNPKVDVEIDRDLAASLGLTMERIESTLSAAYGAQQISTILAPNNEYSVILETEPRHQLDAAALGLLHVKSDSGTLVPLAAVARISPGVGPLSINHSGQLPSVTLSFNLRPGVALGDAVQAVQRAARRVLPAGVNTSFSGTAEAFRASQSGLLWLLALAILVIYIILGILYESFVHPLTILSGLPFAGFGALATLLLFGVELNVYSFVGIIMLVGVVKKNAIMMIDFALAAERGEGVSPVDAILKASSIRFRPIMMTTLAALFGTLPIALGIGAGAESRRPLGLAVVGGLAFSQLVTLYVTPVFYTYLDSFQSWIGRRLSRRPAGPPIPAAVDPAAPADTSGR